MATGDDPQHLGRTLRTARERLRLSQEATAAQLGVSTSTYQEWERGRRFPARMTVIRDWLDAEAASRRPDTTPATLTQWDVTDLQRLSDHQLWKLHDDAGSVLQARMAAREETSASAEPSGGPAPNDLVTRLRDNPTTSSPLHAVDDPAGS